VLDGAQVGGAELEVGEALDARLEAFLIAHASFPPQGSSLPIRAERRVEGNRFFGLFSGGSGYGPVRASFSRSSSAVMPGAAELATA
jgi:hypothetical protein